MILSKEQQSQNNNEDDIYSSEQNLQSSPSNKSQEKNYNEETVMRNEENQEAKYQNQSSYNNQNNCPTPIAKLPLTMVGNVVLTKGMYLTLMKRREQRAFGNTSYSSTPRLQTSQNRLHINKQYSSCARINPSSNNKYNQSNHNFKVGKQSKNASKKQQQTSILENDSQIRSNYQSDKGGQYQEIHKTKRIKKESCLKNITDKRRTRKQSIESKNESQQSLLKDITQICSSNSNQNKQKGKNNNNINYNSNNNKENTILSNITDKNKNESQLKTNSQIKKDKAVIQPKQESQQTNKISMRERSKQIKKDKNNTLSSNIRTRNNAKQQQVEFEEDSFQQQDKENQMINSNIQTSVETNDLKKKNNNINNNNNDMYNQFSGVYQELKYSNIWHEEALDMQTERAMFIQKLKRDKRKKYQQSPKRCVPGYRVKFETSKSKIYAFNCFRDKDLTIDKQYRDVIDIQQDNDYDTDCEQLKESIYNVFQSLCVAVCEEKINTQLQGQTQSSIY